MVTRDVAQAERLLAERGSEVTCLHSRSSCRESLVRTMLQIRYPDSARYSRKFLLLDRKKWRAGAASHDS